MDFKALALCILGVIFAFESFMLWLQIKSAKREIPDNVKDVYEEEAYQKWLAYHGEKTRLALVKHVVTYAVTFAVVASNLYAAVVNALPFKGDYGAALVVLVADMLVGLLVGTPFEYIDTMRIEQKYGFNKTTAKTFAVDTVKNTIISLVLMGGLCMLFICIHKALGNWMLPVFAAILFGVIMLFVCLYPVFSRIFNKFTPLEDGELRDKLMALMEKNHCTVKEIKVMDASKRSTKANAYFSGMGSTKTIVLYDTLLEQMNADEIVAVFAHEMGHNKHKHNIRMQSMSIVNVALIVLIAWALVSVPAIYSDFGFAGVNYGFAVYLLGTVCLAFVSPVFGLLSSGLSRRFEYQADREARDQGYGDALVSALKKLARNSFACLSPHPLLVKLTYSHPTVSQRIDALTEK